jgi:hypothetical protein
VDRVVSVPVPVVAEPWTATRGVAVGFRTHVVVAVATAETVALVLDPWTGVSGVLVDGSVAEPEVVLVIVLVLVGVPGEVLVSEPGDESWSSGALQHTERESQGAIWSGPN